MEAFPWTIVEESESQTDIITPGSTSTSTSNTNILMKADSHSDPAAIPSSRTERKDALSTILSANGSEISICTCCDSDKDRANLKNTYIMQKPSPHSYEYFLLNTPDKYKIHWTDDKKEKIQKILIPAMNKKWKEELKKDELAIPSPGRIYTPKKPIFWEPTPMEMFSMADKIPEIFVTTSPTGRKKVRIPLNCHKWKPPKQNQCALISGNDLVKEEMPSKDPRKLPMVKCSTPTSAESIAVTAGVNESMQKHELKETSLSKEEKSDSPSKIKKAATHSKHKKSTGDKGKAASGAKAGAKGKAGTTLVTGGKMKKRALLEELHSRKEPSTLVTCSTCTRVKIVAVEAEPTKGKAASTSKDEKTSPKLVENKPNTHSHILKEGKSSKCQLLPTKKEVEALLSLAPAPTTKTHQVVPKDKSLLDHKVRCFYCGIHFPMHKLMVHQPKCQREMADARIARQSQTTRNICTVPTSHSAPASMKENSNELRFPSLYMEEVNKGYVETCWFCGLDYPISYVVDHCIECLKAYKESRVTLRHRMLRYLIELRLDSLVQHNKELVMLPKSGLVFTTAREVKNYIKK